MKEMFFLFAALLFGQEFEPEKKPSARHVGCIDPACDLRSVVEDAYENAKFLCDQYYLASPELEIHEHNGNDLRFLWHYSIWFEV